MRAHARAAIIVILSALLWALGAAGLGLATNSLRGPTGLPLVAPFPYEHDCPEKIDLTTPTVDAAVAWRLSQSHRVRGPNGAHGVVFVDARPEDVFAQAHLRGARSIPYSFVTPFSPADAKALTPFAHVFVYCDSPGDRLAQVQAELMRRAGLQRVKVVRGGFAALEKAAGAHAIVRKKPSATTRPATPASTNASTTSPASTDAPSPQAPPTTRPPRKGGAR